MTTADHDYARTPDSHPAASVEGDGSRGRVVVPWRANDHRVLAAADLPETDLGLSERFALWCGADWRYRPGIGWMGYDGLRWCWDEHDQGVRAAIAHVVRSVSELEAGALPALSGDGRRRSAREQRKQWGRSCETPRRMMAALECAQTLPGTTVHEPDWDADPFVLNTLNGLVDLRTGRLRPHLRDHLCTAVVNAPYLHGSRSAALDRVLSHLGGGDHDVVEFLGRWLGYCLTGSMTAEVFLFLSGAAESGKSTLFSAFTRMLGTYAETASAESFAWRPPTGGASPEVARLAGKRFVYIPEAGGVRLDVARVKQIVGGDPIVARLLHQNPVTFRPRCKLAFTANELAVIPDDDDGLRRRLLPLRVATPVATRDSTIRHILENTIEGRAALLAFAVTGAVRWHAGGADLAALQPPAQVREQLSSYLAEMDPLHEWWDERIHVTPTAAITTATLHADYTEWCRRHGVRRVLGMKGFAQRVTARGFPVSADRTHGSVRVGVRLHE
ncbi:phage/plasmid primase, P4 family [Pengzhenrongella phosphoraccumulans]|uniref:DNA primase family protein n=1 Tax=Pengzhenrongella phosphoraccumulans TaxID=3114394 RepID=UPI00388FCEB2